MNGFFTVMFLPDQCSILECIVIIAWALFVSTQIIIFNMGSARTSEFMPDPNPEDKPFKFGAGTVTKYV